VSIEETSDTASETTDSEETAQDQTPEQAETGETADAAEGAAEPAQPIDDGIKRRWYALHAYSGQEANVMKNLLVHAELAGIRDLIGQVLVPVEEVAEIRSGEKKVSKRKSYPGYVFVQLPVHPEKHPELWHMIKDVPGVSGFIGSRTAPVPMEDAEIQAIIEEQRGERERPKPKMKFEQGERVKIIDGPFSNFLGNIDEIQHESGKLKVMVEIFERLTSVEVEFWQVEKI
jgi:transcriptional antiterminator NusG